MLFQASLSWKTDTSNEKLIPHAKIFNTKTQKYPESLDTQIKEITGIIDLSESTKQPLPADFKSKLTTIFLHIVEITQSTDYETLNAGQKLALNNFLAIIYLQFAPNQLPIAIQDTHPNTTQLLVNLYSKTAAIIQSADYETLTAIQKYALDNLLSIIYLRFSPDQLPPEIQTNPIQPISVKNLLEDPTHLTQKKIYKNTPYWINVGGKIRPVTLQCSVLRTDTGKAVVLKPRKHKSEQLTEGSYVYVKDAVQVYGPGGYINPDMPAATDFNTLQNIAEKEYLKIALEYMSKLKSVASLPKPVAVKLRLKASKLLELWLIKKYPAATQEEIDAAIKTLLKTEQQQIDIPFLQMLTHHVARQAHLAQITGLGASCGTFLSRATHHANPKAPTILIPKNIALEFFMCKVSGKELFEDISKRDPSNPNEFLRTFTIACSFINQLINWHLNDVTHRDIKTENAIVNQDGEVKIIDPGFAAHKDEFLPTSTYFTPQTKLPFDTLSCGTPEYVSKEIWEMINTRIPPSFKMLCAADFYALGVSLWILFCGAQPVYNEGDNTQLFANNPEQFCISHNGCTLVQLFKKQFTTCWKNNPAWKNLDPYQQNEIINKTFNLISSLLNPDWTQRPAEDFVADEAERIKTLVHGYCAPSPAPVVTSPAGSIATSSSSPVDARYSSPRTTSSTSTGSEEDFCKLISSPIRTHSLFASPPLTPPLPGQQIQPLSEQGFSRATSVTCF